MVYLIEYSPEAFGQLSRMPGKTSAEIVDRISRRLSRNPTQAEGVREKLSDNAEQERPVWLLQVGRYLVAFGVDEDRRRILVQSIAKIERSRP